MSGGEIGFHSVVVTPNGHNNYDNNSNSKLNNILYIVSITIDSILKYLLILSMALHSSTDVHAA